MTKKISPEAFYYLFIRIVGKIRWAKRFHRKFRLTQKPLGDRFLADLFFCRRSPFGNLHLPPAPLVSPTSCHVSTSHLSFQSRGPGPPSLCFPPIWDPTESWLSRWDVKVFWRGLLDPGCDRLVPPPSKPLKQKSTSLLSARWTSSDTAACHSRAPLRPHVFKTVRRSQRVRHRLPKHGV